MKLVITIIALVTGIAGIWISGGADPHRSCSCEGLSCHCSVTCLSQGEIPNCHCSYFSCSCTCNPKDISTTGDTPVISKDEEANSEKIEGYFRGLGTASATRIANGVKSLREAIHARDARTYYETAQQVEIEYAKLPADQQDQFESWVNTTVKK